MNVQIFSGEIPPESCPMCGGSGAFWDPHNPEIPGECPDCKGRGVRRKKARKVKS